jgi:hypothetical protein
MESELARAFQNFKPLDYDTYQRQLNARQRKEQALTKMRASLSEWPLVPRTDAPGNRCVAASRRETFAARLLHIVC